MLKKEQLWATSRAESWVPKTAASWAVARATSLAEWMEWPMVDLMAERWECRWVALSAATKDSLSVDWRAQMWAEKRVVVTVNESAEN